MLRILAAIALIVLVVAIPTASAQTNAAFTPDSVAALLWSDAVSGGVTTAETIAQLLFEDSNLKADGAGEADRAAMFRRGIVTVASSAAASATSVQAALYLLEASEPGALDGGAERVEIAMAYHMSLVIIVDDAADIAESAAPPDSATRDHWQELAGRVQTLASMIAGSF